MNDNSGNQIHLSFLPFVENAIGVRLLAYLLGCETDSLQSIISGDVPLTGQQGEVVGALSALRQATPDELDEDSKQEMIRAWLTQVGDDGRSIATCLRAHAGQVDQKPSGRDDLENALLALAIDAYPAFLLPPDSITMPMMDPVSFRLTSLVYHHPQFKKFSEVALHDPVLIEVFAHENEHTGRSAMVYRNTGSAGGLQLSMVPQMILRAAWRHLENQDSSPQAFATEAIKELRLVRDVLAGKRHSIQAKLAFAGILLPPGSRLELSDGVVRPVSEADRKLAPDSLKGQLAGTDASGQSTVINYDGDVLFEYKFPYKIRVQRPGKGIAEPWPADMRPPLALERASIRLRFSLMLAVERENRAQLVPTWRYYEEPLQYGQAISWSDPRREPVSCRPS